MNPPRAPLSPVAPHAVFVTGTDTEVGKTRVSAGLLRVLARSGVSAAGLKLVAAGMEEREGRWVNEDVACLRAASSIALSDEEVGPLQFRTPCAPHIAARLEGRPIERAPMRAQVQALARKAQAVVVEGVGGFAVPMSSPESTAPWGMDDVAADLALPVILVVGLRLGCLNHARLTALAVEARGLRLAGWVVNRVDPAMASADENVAALRTWLPGVCLGDVPWLADPDPDAVAAALDGTAVCAALGRMGDGARPA